MNRQLDHIVSSSISGPCTGVRRRSRTCDVDVNQGLHAEQNKNKNVLGENSG